MEPQDLYDVTRGYWRVGMQRESAKYALAVFNGIVQEVYEIAKWFPAGTTFSNRWHDDVDPAAPERFEFVGKIASEDVRSAYLRHDVSAYFPPNSQNPIRYVACSESEE